jgi:hypothetical protein
MRPAEIASPAVATAKLEKVFFYQDEFSHEITHNDPIFSLRLK